MAEKETLLQTAVASTKAETNSDDKKIFSTLIDTTASYTSNEKRFDIIAINGLSGHQEKTWASIEGTTWIRDLAGKLNWEVRTIGYRYDVDNITGAVYPDEAIMDEAFILLEKLCELRSDQQPVFFGCPHRTAGGYHDIDTLATQLRLLTEPDFKASSGNMKGLARSITAINHSFLQTKILTRANIVNVVSTEDDPKAKTDRLSSFFQTIEFQAVPIYPPRSTAGKNHISDWLNKDETFQSWRRSEGPDFLLIHGTIGSSDAAECAFQKLAESEETVFRCILYFKFDRYDVRRNTIGAMAKTFVVQILSQIRTSPATLLGDFEPPDFSDCWTDRDAFLFLDKLRRDLGNAGRVTWVLDGLDQCDESSHWFISEMLGIAEVSEQYFKILITTGDSSHILQALSQVPAIDLTQAVSKTGLIEEVKVEFLTALYQERPQFHRVEPRLRNLLDSCGDDELLRHLLFEWLVVSPCDSTTPALEEELSSLSPLSPSVIFEKALGTVAEEKRPWARKVIMWILRASRPMSPQELASALTLDASVDSASELSTYQDLLWDIKQCLGPLITLDNGSVKLSHPAARDVFISGKPGNDSPWYVLSAPEEDHREIVDSCVRYLSLPKVQDEILDACRGASHGQQILESPLDILSYVIQYWPWHYQLGYSTESSIALTSNITEFLQDKKALQCWAAANWHFSNPHIRADSSFLTPLPILASLGFEDLPARLIKSPDFKDESSISFAITEASRHGHENVVEMLLKNSSMDKSGCLDAIMAASRAGEFGVCRILLKYATESFENIQWPEFLTSRLAYLGPVDLLETILQAGANVNTMDADFSPPIHCSIIGNSTESLDALIKHGADLDSINPNWKDTPSIMVAAKHGRAHMVRTLAKASLDKCDSRGRTALWVAAVTGQHAVLQALLDAGADKQILEVPLAKKGGLPMFIMARGPSPKCLEIALKCGASPNCKLAEGSPSSPISIAAKRGLADICRTLIENGAHVESDDAPPLVHAAMSGSQDVVEVFLEKEAKLDVMLKTPGFCGTPLIAAAEGGYLDIARRLIERGANIDQVNINNSTALYCCAAQGQAEMVKLLIDAGADTQLAHTSGWLPIHKTYGSVETLKVFLEAGADVNSSCPDGTPLYLAAYYDKLDAVKLILSYNPIIDTRCPQEDTWDSGYTPLHLAVCNDSFEMTRLLIEAGADLNIKSPKGGTPLILAVVGKKEESLKALLEYNVDLDVVDNFGDTAIHCMDSPAPLSIAKLLINRGTSLKFRNKRRQTILDSAVVKGDLPFVKLLLDKKADINATDGFNGAALHRAVVRGDIEMAKLLVSKGADVNLVHDWMHGTSLQAVFEWGNSTMEKKDTMARYLINETDVDVNIHGGLLGSALSAAILQGSLDIAKLVIEKGADVGWTDPWGRRPVHIAALRTSEHLRLLLDSGSADDIGIATKTKLGQTALHFAVVTGDTDLVELILSQAQGQISINQPDEDGWTPLLWACRPCDKWGNPDSVKAEMIKLLLDHGADPWVQGRTWEDVKWSPLKMARYHGADDEVVQLLLATKRDKDWDEEAHRSKKGVRLPSSFCDLCFFGVYGVDHECRDCDKLLAFCFKCSRHKEELHPYHNNWWMRGTMFEEGDEDEEELESPKASPDIQQVQDDDSEGDWSNDDEAEDGNGKDAKAK
ncbi:hypothetical protein F53441_1808 [Fusarium austroafricanum]|uniref:Peptidase A2 domain-containing protein n=1 Tax=Fusarium austroafricanum TaxID=2364996 RepID=A0A8H4P4L5_9HYPO|nr:hypothetical protein F53441_1808 [Fusarium austroafricanum]